MAPYPFYIGKCNAGQYNIVGRVWSELDDYNKGKYWLPKEVGQLRDLTCFKANTPEGKNIEDIFFPPVSGPTSMPEGEKQTLQEFMKAVWITFAVVQSVEEKVRIEDVEAKLQNDLVAKLQLAPKWIGDGGQNLAKADLERLAEIKINNPVSTTFMSFLSS